MKTLIVTVVNKKQELLFRKLARELCVEISETNFKPLSTRSATLGIGRKFTEDELHEYIKRTTGGKLKDPALVKKALKDRLGKKSKPK